MSLIYTDPTNDDTWCPLNLRTSVIKVPEAEMSELEAGGRLKFLEDGEIVDVHDLVSRALRLASSHAPGGALEQDLSDFLKEMSSSS